MSLQHTNLSTQHRPLSGFADPGSPAGRIIATLSRLCDAVAAHYQAKREIGELQSLSDQTLRDIGIYRSEIASRVYCGISNAAERRHARR